jgi:hypothetical protein
LLTVDGDGDVCFGQQDSQLLLDDQVRLDLPEQRFQLVERLEFDHGHRRTLPLPGGRLRCREPHGSNGPFLSVRSDRTAGYPPSRFDRLVASAYTLGFMGEHGGNPQDVDADINDRMVRQIEQRRQLRPERRVSPSRPVAIERRRTCSYCYQPGDHPTPAHCLRALER